MSRLLIACLLAAGMTGFADDTPGRVRAYLLKNGVIDYSPQDVVYSVVNGEMKLVGWGIKSVVRPTQADLDAITDVSTGYAPREEIVKDGVTGHYRLRTPAEKKADKEAKVPVATKKLFNRYIRLCHDALVLAEDPRASVLPSVVLSLPELYAVLESADSKNAEKESANSKGDEKAYADFKNAEKKLSKLSRQLTPVLAQLVGIPGWETDIFESDAGE